MKKSRTERPQRVIRVARNEGNNEMKKGTNQTLIKIECNRKTTHQRL